MFILINEEEMEIIAKHPNYGALCDLGCIMCKDDALVIELDHNTFHRYNNPQLEMLYIGLTGEVRDEYPARDKMLRLMVAYANELNETYLVAEEVAAQAAYVLEWDIEGYCSYQSGKKEPNMEEGLWQNPILYKGVEWEQQIIENMPVIQFKTALQTAWK